MVPSGFLRLLSLALALLAATSARADDAKVLSNIGTPTRCDGKNWAGWPCDENAEKLRDQFLHAADDAGRKAVLDGYHRRLMEVQPLTLLGQFDPPFVWRKSLQGVLPAGVIVFWNISKG